MFNSVARYLWGGVENETDYTEGERPEQDARLHESPNPDDGDWVLVDTADKENCCQSAHPYHRNHHPHHHASLHHQSPLDPAGSASHAACEIELLDDAASLAHHLDIQSNKSSRVTTPEYRLPIMELDGIDSSDLEENGIDSGVRPSSPESVFSACSGRSHATYRPKGRASEAWVVAPPPCFTGSQLCDSEPLASSPLENLLIEHPSMSVYYSVPSSALPSSHPLFSIPAIADPKLEVGQATEEGVVVEQEASINSNTNDRGGVASQTVRPRRHSHHQSALHPIQLCPEKLAEKSRIAQRHEVSQKHKDIRTEKCHRWNLVQACSTSTKRSNRRNKLMRPSGCKSSRNHQRMH